MARAPGPPGAASRPSRRRRPAPARPGAGRAAEGRGSCRPGAPAAAHTVSSPEAGHQNHPSVAAACPEGHSRPQGEACRSLAVGQAEGRSRHPEEACRSLEAGRRTHPAAGTAAEARTLAEEEAGSRRAQAARAERHRQHRTCRWERWERRSEGRSWRVLGKEAGHRRHASTSRGSGVNRRAQDTAVGELVIKMVVRFSCESTLDPARARSNGVARRLVRPAPTTTNAPRAGCTQRVGSGSWLVEAPGVAGQRSPRARRGCRAAELQLRRPSRRGRERPCPTGCGGRRGGRDEPRRGRRPRPCRCAGCGARRCAPHRCRSSSCAR